MSSNPESGQKVLSTPSSTSITTAKPNTFFPYIKATPGSNAPTKTDSLRSGGSFASSSENAPHPGQEATGFKDSSTSGLESQASYGGTAPSYVTSQFRHDTKPPHGKNLTEGGFQGSGTDGSPLPEPGSKYDPSRVAEQSMLMGLSASRHARQARKGDMTSGGLEDEQPYQALGSDESA